MSELILELMSEEMPASLLERSAKNIYQLISDKYSPLFRYIVEKLIKSI